MEILVRAVGVLSFLMIGLLAWDIRQERRAPKDERDAKGELKGLKMPALALEFVDDVGEVEAFLGTGLDSPMRRKLRRKLRLDNVFVGLYLALYLVMCVLLARRDFGLAPWLAVFAASVRPCSASSSGTRVRRGRAACRSITSRPA